MFVALKTKVYIKKRCNNCDKVFAPHDSTKFTRNGWVLNIHVNLHVCVHDVLQVNVDYKFTHNC